MGQKLNSQLGFYQVCLLGILFFFFFPPLKVCEVKEQMSQG